VESIGRRKWPSHALWLERGPHEPDTEPIGDGVDNRIRLVGLAAARTFCDDVPQRLHEISLARWPAHD